MESLRQLDDAASRVRAELERREITGSDGRLIDHIVVAQRLSVARMSRRVNHNCILADNAGQTGRRRPLGQKTRTSLKPLEKHRLQLVIVLSLGPPNRPTIPTQSKQTSTVCNSHDEMGAQLGPLWLTDRCAQMMVKVATPALVRQFVLPFVLFCRNLVRRDGRDGERGWVLSRNNAWSHRSRLSNLPSAIRVRERHVSDTKC